MLILKTQKLNIILNQRANSQTAHMCVCVSQSTTVAVDWSRVEATDVTVLLFKPMNECRRRHYASCVEGTDDYTTLESQ